MARSERLARDGYAGLVEAKIELASQFATAIAESLRELVEEQTVD